MRAHDRIDQAFRSIHSLEDRERAVEDKAIDRDKKLDRLAYAVQELKEDMARVKVENDKIRENTYYLRQRIDGLLAALGKELELRTSFKNGKVSTSKWALTPRKQTGGQHSTHERKILPWHSRPVMNSFTMLSKFKDKDEGFYGSYMDWFRK